MSNNFSPLVGYMWFSYLIGGIVVFLAGLVGVISSDNSTFIETEPVASMIFGLIIVVIEIYFIVRNERDSLDIKTLYWIHLILGIFTLLYLIIALLPFLLIVLVGLIILY